MHLLDYAAKELQDILILTLPLLALLFNAANILLLIKPSSMTNNVSMGYGESYMLAAVKSLNVTIRYGLLLCCMIATSLAFHKTFPGMDSQLNLLNYFNSDFELSVDLSRLLILLWLAWLFCASYIISWVMSTIYSYKRKF